ncbi:MAG: hydroxylamine reductase [Kiritimatiellia bacterium]|nr:hydroxylamine reductase [Lentisphaerota bacterium]
MFCYQCEQTVQGQGCVKAGVCGKDDPTATVQDLLIARVKLAGYYAHLARQQGKKLPAADRFVVEGLFSTVTNVNFDPARLEELLHRANSVLEQLRALLGSDAAGRQVEPLPAEREALLALGVKEGIAARRQQFGDDIAGLQELLLYGLKGTAAYVDHAAILGREDDGVYAFFHEALSFLESGPTKADDLLGMCLRCGEVNLKVMELLDGAHTDTFGHPVPTQVRVEPVAGKAILISGHDLADLEALLQQTEGKGVNIYTHGEMLPAHGYPKLKAYKHLVGNYGGAWQDQRKEFDEFPGAILMTTNCIQRPQDSYMQRIFTTGLVAWPGVTHVPDRKFGPVIEAALAAPGFAADGPGKTITVGFAHNAVMQAAGAVVKAVKDGAIRHFFLIGGCDGAKSGRNYYTEFATLVPRDCVILTLACGKFRFNKLDFGDIGGIPRLLDCGQCNDAYSAIRIAVALAEAFNCGVNDLPLSLILSWYEQKAVCILLTLLHLGIRNIRLGPSLPAFVTPAVLQVLVDKFAIKPIGTPQGDLDEILKK